MSDLVPITLRQARQFVTEHHRHNVAPRGWLFGVGLENDNGLIGVAVASRPVAAALQDGRTLEIVRVCTLGDRNANSRLYAAICRAGTALGYTRAITYTLESESGVSLRAAGFTEQAVLPELSWAVHSGRDRYEENLFGERISPPGRRIRWMRPLGKTKRPLDGAAGKVICLLAMKPTRTLAQ